MCKRPLRRVPFQPNRGSSMKSETQVNARQQKFSYGPARSTAHNKKLPGFLRADLQNNNNNAIAVSAAGSPPRNSKFDNQNFLKRSRKSPISPLSKQQGNLNELASVGHHSGVKAALSTPSKTPATAYPTTPSRSPTSNAYAGAKFHDPPSPKVLPKPPVHWVNNENSDPQNTCSEMASVLKVMLKVHT